MILWWLWLVGVLNALPQKNSSGLFLVTLHDKPNNVLLFDSSTSKPMGELITSGQNLDELRGMAIYQDFVFVCNAHDTSSKIVRVPKCGGAAVDFITQNLAHPYDIAVDRTSALLYLDNQDTGSINVYNANTGAFLNVFANVSNPRGLEVDQKGNVFVASEAFNAVLAFSQAGRLIWSLPFDSPIGLTTGFLSDGTEVLLVGSNHDSTASFIASFNLTEFHVSGTTPDQLQTFAHKSLLHPSGVLLLNDIVFGFDQDGQSLLSWKATSGKFLSSVLDVSGPPEQIEFVAGC